MKYYSTRKNAPLANLDEVVFRGIAPDGGLYMPDLIPAVDVSFFSNLHNLTLHEIAFEITNKFLSEYFNDSELKSIIKESLNFNIPLTHFHDNIYSLELFHGLTLAFKDVGARFMARVCQKLLERNKKKNKLFIMVATSGDTGGAVANGFYGVKDIEVLILYPKNRVSIIQEKQFTTLDENITAIEINGSFDDCQKLVKLAFADTNLRKEFFLSTANSINFARLLPQIFYYFYGYAQLKKINPPFSKLVYCVPSGNFGNLTAGIMAQKMELPIDRFIAATNINDVVPTYLQTGVFQPQTSIPTLSSAMDVGNPSNFERILDLYNSDYQLIKKNIVGDFYTDKSVEACIKSIYKKYNYILDPHSAIGYLGIKKFLKDKKDTVGIFIQTAHPTKFLTTVEKLINQQIEIPKRLNNFLKKPSYKYSIKNDYTAFKNFLKYKYHNMG